MSQTGDDADLDKTRDRSAARTASAVGSNARLNALLGGPRAATRNHEAGTDGIRLTALVDAATQSSTPLTAPASVGSNDDPAVRKPRGHRRVDWLSATTAVVAAVAAIGTAVFAGAQMANASPAADAVQVLTTDEAVLASAEDGLVASSARLTERVQTADADAALMRTALSSMNAVPEQSDSIDAASLAGAVHAVDSYRAGLAEITLPALPAQYARGSIDEGSLSSVGEAIDRVQTLSADVDATRDALRSVGDDIDALNGAYETQLAAFKASFTAAAVAEVEANPVAADEFRSTVTAAAAAVAAAPPNAAATTKALTAYRDAVIALRDADMQARVDEEAERNTDVGEQYTYNEPEVPTDQGTTDSGTTDSGVTDSGTTDEGTTPPSDGTETPAG